jgi:hypothetical protein
VRKSLCVLFSGVVAIACFAALLGSCKSSTAPKVVSGELNGSLAPAAQYAHTFNTAGTFNYHCTIHPGCASLAGKVVVIPPGGVVLNRVLAITQSGGSSGPYGSTCSSLSLQVDTVFVGDQVTWTNNSPFPHTVTSQ